MIAERVTKDELEEIRSLLSHKWIGKTEEPGSVASNLKRVFGYDLARTRGLSAGFLDQVRGASSSELVRLVGVGVSAVLIFMFGWWVKKHGF